MFPQNDIYFLYFLAGVLQKHQAVQYVAISAKNKGLNSHNIKFIYNDDIKVLAMTTSKENPELVSLFSSYSFLNNKMRGIY